MKVADDAVDRSCDDLLEELLDEIANRLKNGEKVDIEDYARRHADIAQQLRDMFPAMQLLAHAGGKESGEADSAADKRASPTARELGDFQILREIGRGGMGVVYKARQLSLGRYVALKVLPFAATMDARHLQRFHNEARAAATLQHPHIVPVYAVGEERGIHYYAMQFIEGQTLAESVQQKRRSAAGNAREQISADVPIDGGSEHSLPDRADTRQAIVTEAFSQLSHQSREYFNNVARIGIQAAEALEHAHSMGIVHRDIKPGNLMLDGNGNVWITDFGLARTATDAGLTMTGDVLGTLRYMSPEQALAKHDLVDHRSDVYSLGVTLYELLTLRPAIAAKNRHQILQQIAFEELAKPRKMNPALPSELETVILKAVAKAPGDRYASAQELADDLSRFQENRPVRARRIGPLGRLRRWSQRNSLLATLGSVTFLALLASVIILAISSVRIDAERAEAIRQAEEARKQKAAVLKREKELRQYAYALDMKFAWQTWENTDLNDLPRLLSRYVPENGQDDLRSFPWYYLDRLLRHSSLHTFDPKEGALWHLDWSPDGKTLAIVGEAPTVKLWDVDNKIVRSKLHGHANEINCVAYSPSGELLATASDDGSVKVWDVTAGKVRGTLVDFDQPIHIVLFSCDSRWLAVGEVRGTTARATIWDTSTWKKVQVMEDHYPLDFHPQENLLATTTLDFSIRIWNADSGQKARTLRGCEQVVTDGIFLAPDGDYFVSYSRENVLRKWNVDEEKIVKTWQAGVRPTRSLCQHASGLLSWGGDDAVVNVYDESRPARPRYRLRGHTNWISCVRFSPDGALLASASRDGTVRLWSAKAIPGQRVITNCQGTIDSLAFSPGGVLAAAESDRCIRFWDPHSGTVLSTHSLMDKENVNEIRFSADGRLLVAASERGAVHVLETNAGRWQHPVFKPTARYYHYVALSPEGNFAAIEDRNQGITTVLDVARGNKLMQLELGVYRSTGITGWPAVTRDGERLFSAAGSRLVCWSLKSGKLARVLTNHTGQIINIAVSPDGNTLASGGDSRIVLWDIDSGIAKHILFGHKSMIRSLAFSPDNKTLASGSESGEILIWDVATGQQIFALPGTSGAIRSLVFSPDGMTLAAASEYQGRSTVTLWSAIP